MKEVGRVATGCLNVSCCPNMTPLVVETLNVNTNSRPTQGVVDTLEKI